MDQNFLDFMRFFEFLEKSSVVPLPPPEDRRPIPLKNPWTAHDYTEKNAQKYVAAPRHFETFCIKKYENEIRLSCFVTSQMKFSLSWYIDEANFV